MTGIDTGNQSGDQVGCRPERWGGQVHPVGRPVHDDEIVELKGLGAQDRCRRRAQPQSTGVVVRGAQITDTTDDRPAQERGSGTVLLRPVVGVLGVGRPGACDDCCDE